jgi:PAS domain S-box-containing protein
MNKIAILLVEDNNLDERLIKEMLKEISSFNYELITSGTLKDCCEQIQKKHFDIILLDLNLPDSTGQQTFQKANDCSKGIPIVLVSGLADEELSLKLIKEGAQDYITKQSLNSALLEKSILYSIERKQTELVLKQSERHYRVLAENMVDTVCVHDIKGFYTFISSSVSILLGYSSDELLNTNPLDIVHPDDKEDYINKIRPIILSGTYWRHECRYIRKDGTSVWVEVNGKPVHDNNNVITSYQTVTRNIADRKQIEIALKRSEEKFRNLVETTNDFIWETNTEGLFTYASPQIKFILGYGLDEIMNHSPFEFMPPDEAEKIKKRSDEIVATKKPFNNLININLHKDGQAIFFETSGVPMLDANNNLLGYCGIDRDITERLQSEEIIRKSHEKYQAIFESTGTATLIVEEDQTILMANHECLMLTGYAPSELIGQKWIQFVAPESLQEMVKNHNLRRQNNNAAPKKYEVKLLNKKREIRFAVLDIEMVPETKQSIVSILDITERILAEKLLKESEERFRTIFEQAGVGVALLNTKTGQFIRVNQKYCDFVGYTMQEMLQKTFMDITFHEDVQINIDKNTEFVEGKIKEFSYEKRYTRKNGEIVWGNLTVSPLWKPGEKPLEYLHIAIVENITDRKHAEEKIRKHHEEEHLLSEVSGALVSINQLDEIYNYIGNIIYNLVPESFIFLSSYIPESKSVKINHSFGFHKYFKSITDKLGIDPFGLEIGISEMTAEELRIFKSRSLVKIEEGLYALSARKVNKSICRSIEKILGVKAVYTMGFTWKDKLYGGVTIMQKNNNIPENTALIETIINQTAITIQRKMSQDELMKSEEKYRMLADNATDIVWVLDIKTQKFTYVSPAVEKIRGYTVEEALEIPFSKTLTPANYLIAMKKLTEAIEKDSLHLFEQGRTRTIEFEEFHKNGSIISTETNLRFLRDSNGRPFGIMGVTRDISERKKNETLIKAAADEWQKTFDASTDAIALLDTSCRMLRINKTMLTLSGKEENEVLHQHCWKILHGTEKSIAGCPVEKVFKSKKRETFEFAENHKWYEVLADPVLDNSGEITGLVHIVRDITERKKAEEKLRESEEKFSKTFKTSPYAITITEPSSGKIIDVNDGFCNVSGYIYDEIIGKSTIELHLWENENDRIYVINELKNKRKINNREFRFLKKSGEVMFGLFSADIIHLNDKPSILSSINDISERKHSEEILEFSKAQLSNAIEIAHLGHWEYDTLNDLFTFNDHFFKIFNTTVEKVGGYTMSSAEYARRFVYPDDAFMVGEETRKAIETTDPNFSHTLEHRMLYADGTVGHVSVRFFIQKDALGRTVKTFGVNQDITARKKSEIDLKESEAKFRNIFSNIQDCYYETLLDGTILEVSPSIKNISQFDREDLIGKNMNVFYADPDDRETLIKELSQKKSVNDYGITLLDKDKNKIRCSITTKIISDNSGHPTKIVGSMRNIEERIKAEEEMHKALEKYKELFDSSNDIIYTMDFQGNFTSVNPAAEKILGYELEKLSNKSMTNFISEESAKLAFDNIAKKLKGKESNTVYEVGFRNNNGSETDLEINSMIRYKNGKPLEIFGIARDITEKKKIANELKSILGNLEKLVAARTEELTRSEELYLTTVNSLIDWIFVIDEKFKIVFVNQLLKDFLTNNGITVDVIGKNFKDVFVFLDESNFKFYDNVFTDGRMEINEGQYNVFGKEYFTQTKISPVIRDNKVIRAVTTVHDYTKLKSVEEEIRKNLLREKELNSLKSQFISTVSHEFRTPLAGILSSAQLLKLYSNKWDEEKKGKVYKQIFDSVQHTIALLDDVSLINKGESNAITVKPSMMNLQGLLSDIIKENQLVYGADFEIASSFRMAKSEYFFDPEIIRHVFGNIISNAIKYSGESKKIIFNVTEEKDKIIFNVIDYGIGIPEEDQKFLFEPFHRASNVEAIRGTGFGLSIVKRLVDLLYGEIEIISEPGKGTSVTIKLPIAKAPNEEK